MDEQNVIDRVFVDENDGSFLLAQWQQVADTFSITDKAKAKSLVARLRRIVETDNKALRTQVVELHNQIAGLKVDLADTENQINELMYEAYELTEDERRLVENG